MLKAELHAHVKGDPEDNIQYSVYELIDNAKEKGFQVLAVTCHNLLFEDIKAVSYAKKKGILLMLGIEKEIEGKHILIYNISKEINKVDTISKLKEFKKRNKDILIIAPHPFFYLSECLGKKILSHIDLFDAWEYSYFYTLWFNPNKKLVRLSKKYKKPLIGSSDVHNLEFLGQTYTLIDSKLEKKEIIKAIKKGKTKIVTKPLSSKIFIRRILNSSRYITKSFLKFLRV